MIFAIGKTATLRKGVLIPGGQKFEVSATEVESFLRSGYAIVEEDSSEGPKTGSINIPPEKETLNIPKIYPGENPNFIELSEDASPRRLSGASSKVTKPMGNASGKAKTSSKVSSKKEG